MALKKNYYNIIFLIPHMFQYLNIISGIVKKIGGFRLLYFFSYLKWHWLFIKNTGGYGYKRIPLIISFQIIDMAFLMQG